MTLRVILVAGGCLAAAPAHGGQPARAGAQRHGGVPGPLAAQVGADVLA